MVWGRIHHCFYSGFDMVDKSRREHLVLSRIYPAASKFANKWASK